MLVELWTDVSGELELLASSSFTIDSNDIQDLRPRLLKDFQHFMDYSTIVHSIFTVKEALPDFDDELEGEIDSKSI